MPTAVSEASERELRIAITASSSSRVLITDQKRSSLVRRALLLDPGAVDLGQVRLRRLRDGRGG